MNSVGVWKRFPRVETKHLLTIVKPCTRVWKFGKRRLNMEYLLAYARTHAYISRLSPSLLRSPLFSAHWQHENSHKQIYTNEAATLWHLPIGVSSSYLYSCACVHVWGYHCRCVRVYLCALAEGPALECEK